MKSNEWNIQKVMLAWTVCLGISVVSGGVWLAASVSQISKIQQQVDQEMRKEFRESELQLNIKTE